MRFPNFFIGRVKIFDLRLNIFIRLRINFFIIKISDKFSYLILKKFSIYAQRIIRLCFLIIILFLSVHIRTDHTIKHAARFIQGEIFKNRMHIFTPRCLYFPDIRSCVEIIDNILGLSFNLKCCIFIDLS